MSHDDPAGSDGDLAAVLAANQAFYDAFEAGDLDAMSELWEHSERVVCTHPGWATLRGWGPVAGSWYAIFGGPERLQVILTQVHADRQGPVAWVTADENLLGPGPGGTAAALNLFVEQGEPGSNRWKMIAHHASPVSPSAPRLAGG